MDSRLPRCIPPGIGSRKRSEATFYRNRRTISDKPLQSGVTTTYSRYNRVTITSPNLPTATEEES
jgi:hypothetical protein